MTSCFDATRPVAIIGAGVMGTKVAWACARSGLATRLYDVEPGKAAAAATRAGSWGDEALRARLARHLEPVDRLDAALAHAQLVFENVPEKLALKQSVLAELGRQAPDDAFLGSNASSITCTPLALASGRSARFFNLNFSDPRSGRLTELMLSPFAAAETRAFALAWSAHIGMIAIETRKEQLGYSFNRLWRVIKQEALRQIAEGYATPESIDRAWMLAFGMPIGPCGIMDEIGLHTVRGIERVYFEASQDPRDRPPAFLDAMVEAGRLGVASGEGFYRHPDPPYGRPGFVEGRFDRPWPRPANDPGDRAPARSPEA